MLWFVFSIELGVNVMRAPQDGLRSMASIPPQFASTFFFALAGDNVRAAIHKFPSVEHCSLSRFPRHRPGRNNHGLFRVRDPNSVPDRPSVRSR